MNNFIDRGQINLSIIVISLLNEEYICMYNNLRLSEEKKFKMIKGVRERERERERERGMD